MKTRLPGAREQDRDVREDLDRPGIRTPAIPKDVEDAVSVS